MSFNNTNALNYLNFSPTNGTTFDWQQFKSYDSTNNLTSDNLNNNNNYRNPFDRTFDRFLAKGKIAHSFNNVRHFNSTHHKLKRPNDMVQQSNKYTN